MGQAVHGHLMLAIHLAVLDCMHVQCVQCSTVNVISLQAEPRVLLLFVVPYSLEGLREAEVVPSGYG